MAAATASMKNPILMAVTDLALQGEGTFSGQVHADTLVPHGFGHMQYDVSSRGNNTVATAAGEEEVGSYEGQWNWGQWHGPNGVLQFRNGDSYIGSFSHNARHGQGVYIWCDGRCYEGEFHRNQRHGQGTFTFADGGVYQGSFLKGRRHGYGRYDFPNGNSYEGEWVAGEYEGYGVFNWNDGRIYRGEWSKSKHHGGGVLLDPLGQVVYNGIWVDHQPSTDALKTNGSESAHKIPAYPQEITIYNGPPDVDDCSELGMSVFDHPWLLPLPLHRRVTPPAEERKVAPAAARKVPPPTQQSQPVRQIPPARPVVFDSTFDRQPPPSTAGLQNPIIKVGPTRTQQIYRFAVKPPVQQQQQQPLPTETLQRPATIGNRNRSQGESPAHAPFLGLPQITALLQEHREARAMFNDSGRQRRTHPQDRNGQDGLNYIDNSNLR